MMRASIIFLTITARCLGHTSGGSRFNLAQEGESFNDESMDHIQNPQQTTNTEERVHKIKVIISSVNENSDGTSTPAINANHPDSTIANNKPSDPTSINGEPPGTTTDNEGYPTPVEGLSDPTTANENRPDPTIVNKEPQEPTMIEDRPKSRGDEDSKEHPDGKDNNKERGGDLDRWVREEGNASGKQGKPDPPSTNLTWSWTIIGVISFATLLALVAFVFKK
ncbi:hypothetical protein DSO57_1002827 [Entomophthora muscae]|uniref:Uncharacterized protein n=1 Tax=Entomophthora muscae TaxID=34485 RepID=A0ACC2RZI3_9FUNG|nr:hypothetical protein DSO57_1002827 [Entomophthora muscae]